MDLFQNRSNNFKFYFRLAFRDVENPYASQYIKLMEHFSSEPDDRRFVMFQIIPKVFFKTRKLKVYSDNENIVYVSPREYLDLHVILSCYYSQIGDMEVYLKIVSFIKRLTGKNVLIMKRFGISFTENERQKFEQEQTEKWLKSGRCKKRNNHKCRKRTDDKSCEHKPIPSGVGVINKKDS